MKEKKKSKRVKAQMWLWVMILCEDEYDITPIWQRQTYVGQILQSWGGNIELLK